VVALRRKPYLVFVGPALLSLIFCSVLLYQHALSQPMILLVLIYTFVPTACAFVQGPAPKKSRQPPTWLDFAIILMLWLPLEFAAGRQWIPRALQGTIHTIAYAVAIALAVWLFLGFRGLKGMKCNLPKRITDLIYPLVGFAVAAPILIGLGLLLNFIHPFHVPKSLSAWTCARTFLLILVATALPEEILFRALIQNFLMQKFGSGNRVLVLSGVIFGCAHLNNGPGPPPNWRYMVLATIAGVIYGKVFLKSSTILSSAGLHALVNTVKHAFF
jgi:membrane protease YdiL (CAAX protease family)